VSETEKHKSHKKSNDKSAIQTKKDIIIRSKAAGNQERGPLAQDGLKIPAPISELPTKSEQLPVYTQKQWVPNMQDLEEENIKDGPTLAKVKQVQSNATAQTISITVLPEKETWTDAANLQL
jgi:hypothetical protein